MERILHSHIINHLESAKILSDQLHGFLKGSNETQLINIIQDLAYGIKYGYQIDCVLLRFSMAFNKVLHKLLMNKCQYYGT